MPQPKVCHRGINVDYYCLTLVHQYVVAHSEITIIKDPSLSFGTIADIKSTPSIVSSAT